jgi:hypothetical protein
VRVAKPGGEIRLAHPADYAEATHAAVADAVKGKIVNQTTQGDYTRTTIAVPREPPQPGARP